MHLSSMYKHVTKALKDVAMNMLSADGYRSEDDVHLGIIHEDEISPGEFRRVIRDSAVAHSARKKQPAQRASAEEIIAFADPPEDDDCDCCTDLQSLDGFEEVHSAFLLRYYPI